MMDFVAKCDEKKERNAKDCGMESPLAMMFGSFLRALQVGFMAHVRHNYCEACGDDRLNDLRGKEPWMPLLL